MENKYCPKCKQTKPKTEFYKSKKRYDGVRAYCKECELKKQRDNFKYFRDYNRKRYANNNEFKLKIRKSRAKYNLNNIEKKRAKDILYLAIKRGQINKKPCVVCGNKNSQGHHFDYSKKLDVIWLCPKHHRQIHTGRIDLLLQDLNK